MAAIAATISSSPSLSDCFRPKILNPLLPMLSSSLRDFIISLYPTHLMKRAWRISDSAARPCLDARSSIAAPHSFTIVRQTNWHPDAPSADASTSASTIPASTTSTSTISDSIRLQSFISLFLDKFSCRDEYNCSKDMRVRVTILRKDLLANTEDPGGISRFLDETALSLLQSYPICAYAELLEQLLSSSSPHLSLEVLTWRRKQSENGLPMTSEEYTKGIKAAGRCKNVDLAVELFTEAGNEGLKTIMTYNALMAAYMYNGQYLECQDLFRDLKRDGTCKPSIVTYNILISVFGHSMLVNHMETAFKEIEAQGLKPNLGTYNNLIEGYLLAFMWDHLERTFQKMKASWVKPNIRTYALMLRGYANSRNITKMEEMYELVQWHDKEKLIPLMRLMITAYCWSSVNNRVERIEALLRLIPENEYRPWLNVMLIRLYAQEDRIEKMEKYINEAIEHGTSIHTVGIMRSIIGSYGRCNEVDKLSNFVRLAESAGWKMCRSLFHSKLVLYGSADRLEEMEGVLSEMENFNYAVTKKTFLILYKSYSNCGKKYKVDQVVGLMCKHGYGIPMDPSF